MSQICDVFLDNETKTFVACLLHVIKQLVHRRENKDLTNPKTLVLAADQEIRLHCRGQPLNRMPQLQ